MTEHEAAEYLQRFDALRVRFFDLSLDLLAIAGFDGYFKSVNPVWTDVLGFTEAELLSRPYIEFVHPDDREATAGATMSLVNGMQVLSFRNRYIAKDGSYRWLSWKAMPVTAESVVFATARDVTTEMETVAKLEAAEDAIVAAHDKLARSTEDLCAIGEASRAITASSADPRHEICVAVARITGAAVVSLFEPANGALVPTASVGLEMPLEPIAYERRGCGAAQAFRTGERLFVLDVSASSLITLASVGASGAASAAFQPVLRDQTPCGVLSLAWAEPAVDFPARMSVALDLLAAETAMVIERADLRKLLVGEARIDGLTGIANRRAWDEEAPRFIERARRSGRPLSLAAIDIDDFKRYNDVHGHQAGDRLLRTVAQAWQRRLRSVDLIARVGGDEFMVVLGNCALAHARLVCDALRSMHSEMTMSTTGVHVTSCSIGVAEWSGAESLDVLANRADVALYVRKRDGGDRSRNLAVDHPLLPSVRPDRPAVEQPIDGRPPRHRP